MAIGSPRTEGSPDEPGAVASSATAERAAGRRPSLRRRLAVVFAGLALLIALLQASFVWFVGYKAEEQMIDRILAEQLARGIALHWQQPALAAPNTPDMSLFVVPDGDASAKAALPAWLRALPRQAGTHELEPEEGIEYHVAIARDRDAWFFLVYDVAEHESRQRDEIATLALSVLAIGALAMLLSGRMAGRLTRDLLGLSAAVGGPREDAAGAARLGEIAAYAETAKLADALDAYRDRLREALARERAFTAAANHELRTPLMRAGSSLDLLRAGELDNRQLRLVDNVQSSLDEMTMLTAALLRVARGQSAEAASETDVGRLVAEVLGRLSADAQARRIELSAQLPPGLVLRVDRSALWIVLANLVRNAIRHSGGTRVVVGAQDGELLVDDDGIGIDANAGTGTGAGARQAASGAAAPTQAPARGAQQPAPSEDASDGLGLGIAIVSRICDAAGWRLSIASRPGGGTRATVCIPSA